MPTLREILEEQKRKKEAGNGQPKPNGTVGLISKESGPQGPTPTNPKPPPPVQPTPEVKKTSQPSILASLSKRAGLQSSPAEGKPTPQREREGITETGNPPRGNPPEENPPGKDNLEASPGETSQKANPVTIEPRAIEHVAIPAEVSPEYRLQIEDLQKNLDYLIANIDDSNAVGPVVRNILAKLQSTPDLCVFVTNQTMNQITRGLRASFKFEARKAVEKRETKGKKNAKVDQLAQAFNDLGFKL